MKGYVLALFLLVGFVWSASAQQVDPQLVGNWRTYDGPCRPCVLTIQKNGTVKFNYSGTDLEVVGSQITPDPGVKLTLPLSGTLDLSLTKSSKYLVATTTTLTKVVPINPSRFGASERATAHRAMASEQHLKSAIAAQAA